MKKLLKIIFIIAVSLQSALYCENLVDSKSKSIKNYCNEKIETAKEKLNNGYKWVKNYPKKSIAIYGTSLLISAAWLIFVFEAGMYKQDVFTIYKLRFRNLYLKSKIYYYKFIIFMLTRENKKLQEMLTQMLDNNTQLRKALDPNSKSGNIVLDDSAADA